MDCWGRCAGRCRQVYDPPGEFLGGLFPGLQKSLDVVGVSDWEGQCCLRRWVFACGWESADHEASVVAGRFPIELGLPGCPGGLRPSSKRCTYRRSASSLPSSGLRSAPSSIFLPRGELRLGLCRPCTYGGRSDWGWSFRLPWPGQFLFKVTHREGKS